MSINGFANGEKSERDAALHSMREQDDTAEFSVESSTKELEEFEARLERHNPSNNNNNNDNDDAIPNEPVDLHKEEKAKNANVPTVTRGQHPPITSNATARHTENNVQSAMSEMHVQQRPAHKPRLTEEELERRLERQQDIADVRKLSNE